MLRLYPRDRADPARNMALDLALLERAGEYGEHAFRSYGWTGAALTFGYRQRWQDIMAARPQTIPAEHCQRRPSGGGMVDHRHDWTYALVVAAGSPLYRLPARESYRFVHGLWRDAFASMGLPTELAPCPAAAGCTASTTARRTDNEACFAAPSPDDLLNSSGRKIAGAAQKRTRSGLLIQGSIDPAALPRGCDRDICLARFRHTLIHALATHVEYAPDMSLLQGPGLERQIKLLGSIAWMRKR